MQLTGTILHISAPIQLTDKFRKINIVLDLTHTYQGNTYTNHAVLQALNQAVDRFQGYYPGDKVTISFTLHGTRTLQPLFEAYQHAVALLKTANQNHAKNGDIHLPLIHKLHKEAEAAALAAGFPALDLNYTPHPSHYAYFTQLTAFAIKGANT